ncbi:MAG: sulfurtransferase TusA family protein [Nitrospinota bacterium]|nr:sulfurtransferase TusA family protein [Nitrospinota bacterium]
MKAWDRPRLQSMDDIRREISKSPKPLLTPDQTLELGDCGMGMPVILSAQALNKMAPGQLLLLRSGHP